MKRFRSWQRTSFNAAELAVPKILHQMLCTTASYQVVAALGCHKSQCVFASAAGLLYPSFDSPNPEMGAAYRLKCEQSLARQDVLLQHVL